MAYLTASANLTTIQQKIRRLTRSPFPDQISNADINQYINTFIEFDMPTSIKLFSLRSLFTFYTQPGVDVYKTNTTNPNDPLYQFQNKYTAIHDPIFISGVEAFFTQDREVFYGNWPQTNTVQQTQNLGNGTPGPFTGIVPAINTNPTPTNSRPFIQQNSVIFTILDTNGNAMVLTDNPISNTVGVLGLPTQPQTNPALFGQVNYVSGAYTVTFPNNTQVNSVAIPNPLWVEYIAYAPGLPTTILYYANQFTLRPIPDKSYPVQLEVNVIPTDLIADNDLPQISQWWQYIAYGAAIKILLDRTDFDTAQSHQAEFARQEELVLSTSNDQYTNQRTVTIYTNNGEWNAWNNFGRWPY